MPPDLGRTGNDSLVGRSRKAQRLLAAAKGLNEGHDLAGHEIDPLPHLCLGAVVNAGSEDLEIQLLKTRKKIDAGAEFFQTQAIFDAEAFARFMEKAAKFGAPVMAASCH